MAPFPSSSSDFSTGPMALVDIQMSDHATQTPGFTFAVEPYDQCHLRKDSTGQMRLMLVPLWSLREVQNELVVIPGHLSLATPLTNTGLHIADILTIMAPGADGCQGGSTSMTGLINDRSRNDGPGLLLPPKICPTLPEGQCYTIVGQIQVRNWEGQEEETAGPQTWAEYMMGTEWVLMWKHPQGIDRREGPPLYGWILLVIPVHSLLARSNTSCVNPSLPVYSRFVSYCHNSKA